jgi:hypothetical protein
MLNCKSLFFSLSWCLACATTVLCQQKIYRGSIGGSHVEMRLTFEGNKVSGTYSYDRIGEEIKLSGQITATGGMELTEFDARHKPSGKIGCKRKLDDPNDAECYWSRVDGSHQAFVTLEAQQGGPMNGLRLVPKTINDRATGVVVSYPQLASDQALPAGAEGFNKDISAWIKKAVKDFDPESSSGRASFDLNYNVLLAANDLISIEITEYADNGGAHPNTGYWAMTYDLNKNKEVAIEDIFKRDSDYQSALAKFVVADIQKRADALDEEEARSAGRTPSSQKEQVVSADQLSDIANVAITAKGLMVYFDFPHVIAVFDRTLVPYPVIKDYLQPNGPATRFQ